MSSKLLVVESIHVDGEKHLTTASVTSLGPELAALIQKLVRETGGEVLSVWPTASQKTEQSLTN